MTLKVADLFAGAGGMTTGCALVEPIVIDGKQLDIRFRMLKPHELAAAMGFPRDYQFTGTKTDQVRQIGNAVSVRIAAALCESALPGLRRAARLAEGADSLMRLPCKACGRRAKKLGRIVQRAPRVLTRADLLVLLHEAEQTGYNRGLQAKRRQAKREAA